MAAKFSKIYKILICGGSADSRERNVRSSCELLTLNVEVNNGIRNFQLTSCPFAALNIPRRGASLHRLAANKFVIIGGCSEPGKNLRCIEVYDLILNKWTLLPYILRQERSCFVSHRFHNSILCYGGWNGQECITSGESINIDFLIDECSCKSTQEEHSVIFKPKLDFPLKNSCCLALDASITENENRRTMEMPTLFIVGGWDGKRTLDSIFSTSLHTSFRETSAVAIEKPNDNDETTFIDTISSSFTHFRNLPYPIECHTCNIWSDDDDENRRVFIITGGFDGQHIIDKILIGHLCEKVDFTYNLCRLSLPRECHCSEILDDRFLIVMGGWDGYKAMKSVEIFEILPTDNGVPISLKSVEFFDDILLEGRNRPCSAVFP